MMQLKALYFSNNPVSRGHLADCHWVHSVVKGNHHTQLKRTGMANAVAQVSSIFLLCFALVRSSTLPNCSSFAYVDRPYTVLDESVHLMCGTYHPADCNPDEKIAILIPYRNREFQLKILLNFLVQYLVNHRKYFGIFVMEPLEGQTFNRGKLFNVGFDVAMSMDDWDCFFFHDVDLLPTNPLLPYKCPPKGSAQHWSAAIDKNDFKLPYTGYVGGVGAMNTNEYVSINGFPNEFWGWGGEDDCFGYRIEKTNLSVYRAPNSTYTMLRHQSNEKGNEVNPCRGKLLKWWKELWFLDGLNSMTYNVTSLDAHNTHYHVFVDTQPPSDKCNVDKLLRKTRDGGHRDSANEELPRYKLHESSISLPTQRCLYTPPSLLGVTDTLSARTLLTGLVFMSAASLVVICLLLKGLMSQSAPVCHKR